MRCKTIHKKLIFFIEGELPQIEMREMALHLDECSDCTAFAAEIKKTMAILELEKNIPVTSYFFNRIKARMENRQEEAIKNISFPLWERFLQPAMFSVLLLTGIYSGIKLGGLTRTELPESGYAQTEIIPFLNELEAEPLEMFLME